MPTITLARPCQLSVAMGTLPSADGSIEYLHHAVHVYTYRAFVLTASRSLKSMELETDSCSYWELVKQSALNSYHIAWLLCYIHVSSRRINAQRRIANYSQCQPLFSTIQMTDLLAAVPPPLHTHNVDVCANLWYAGVICALAQQACCTVVFIVPVITGRMQDIIGYDSHTPLSMFIEQAHCNQRMCFSSGMHGKYSLASVWWWWKVDTCVMVLPSHSCISETHPPTPPHTHLHTETHRDSYVATCTQESRHKD